VSVPLPFIIDSHQDIAWHTRLDAPAGEGWMVTLESLLSGGVMLSLVSLFAEHNEPREARKRVLRSQLEFYDSLLAQFPGIAVKVQGHDDLEALRARWEAGQKVWGFLMAMEGADLLDEPEEVAWWYQRGARIIGLTWNERNQWAAGAKQLGGITKGGLELLHCAREQGFILDVSHINQQSFRDELHSWDGPVCATHGNPFTLCRHPRNYTDAQLAELKSRGGVMGALLYNGLLAERWSEDGPMVQMSTVCAHIEHLLEHLGPEGVGIGSDFDGGPTVLHTPEGMQTVADLRKVGEALRARGHGAEVTAGVLGENWYRFLMRHLP
jgi:membrane dipeptidase